MIAAGTLILLDDIEFFYPEWFTGIFFM